MKLGAVTKIYKENTSTSKLSEDDVLLANCDVFFLTIYPKFRAIRKPESRRMVYKICFILHKLKIELKNSYTALIL